MRPEIAAFLEQPEKPKAPPAEKRGRDFELPETNAAETFEHLNRHMDAILRTKESLTELEHGPRLSEPEMEAALTEIRESFLIDTLGAITPEVTLRHAELLEEIHEASGRLHYDLEIESERAVSDEDSTRWSELEKEKTDLKQELEELDEELEELENDSEWRTVAAIDGLIGQLRKKAAWIRSQGDDREAVQEEIGGRGYSIDDDQVTDVRTGNLSVNVTLRPNFFEEDVYGLHLTGSPINLIAADGNRQNTERHEQMHNFFYEPPQSQSFDIETAQNSLKRTSEDLTLAFPETGREKESLRAEIERLDVDRALDSLKNELLAELERVELDWETEPVDWEERFSPHSGDAPRGLEDEFLDLTANYSTAGKQARDLVRTLQETSGKDELGPEITDLAWSKRQRFMRQFVRAVNGLKRGLLLATFAEGTMADDYTHAFAYLTKPTQYRHLPAALRHRFGAERYDRVRAGLDAIMGLGTKPLNLDLLLEIEEDQSYPGRDYLRLHLGDGLAAALKHGAALEMFRAVGPEPGDDPDGKKLESHIEKVRLLLEGLELDEGQINELENGLRRSAYGLPRNDKQKIASL